MSQSKHEEIFETKEDSNDGMQTAQLTNFRESLIEKTYSGDAGDAQLIANCLKPEDAFQVFNGKVFSIPRTEYTLADAIERRVESPIQRYSRLRSELEELQSDLDRMASETEGSPNSIWSVLQEETKKLSQSANQLEQHRGMKKVKNEVEAPGKILDDLVAGLKNVAAIRPKVKSGREEVAVKNSDVLELEKRIFRLETFLGITSNVIDLEGLNTKSSLLSAFPLIEVISKLEQRIAMMDINNLDTIRAKTNVLKADLETTLKTKAASAESKAIDAARKVEDLVDKVQKVEAVADDLPNLVIRLKTLESIHMASSTFAARLTSVERDTRLLSGELQSNKDVLLSLKEGLKENIAIMQSNIKETDKKIAALIKK